MTWGRWNHAKKRDQNSKMGNTPSVCTLGHSHRSKLEGAVCQMLQLREKAGELEIVQAEDHVYLTLARVLYVPDFKCRDTKTGEFIWIEAKGFASDRWPTIRKLWKVYGPGVLEIWKGTYRNPMLTETIIPRMPQDEKAGVDTS